MKIVIDTNVLISGIFFSGPPSEILDACFSGSHKIAVSQEIYDEYLRVGLEFSKQKQNPDFKRFLGLLLRTSLFVEVEQGLSKICVDQDDDKFIHCALASGATHVISGDRHLLDVSGYGGIEILTPRDFFKKFIQIE